MSYELDSSRYTECPCGKGRIVVETYSNDWNQSETKYYIDCDDCQKIYVLTFEGHRGRKGECYTIPYLVNKATEEKVKITFDKRGGSHAN